MTTEYRSTGDWMHTITKMGLSAFPVIGGPATELFSFLVAAPATKRREEWLASVATRLLDLERKLPGTVESLSERDDFVTASIHATQIAIRTHQRSKLEALRNALLHVATGTAPDEDRQLMFLTWVDTFTETHLRCLALCGPVTSVPALTTLQRELSTDRAFTQAVLHDLSVRGLIVDGRESLARNDDDPSKPLALLQWSLSNVGQQFTDFISESKLS